MYKNLEQALLELEKAGMLKRIHREVDPYLEMAEIARQTFEAHSPALLFEHVKGSPFRAAANIFGTRERMDFLFRDTLKGTQTAVLFKSNPIEFFRHASVSKLCSAALTGLHSLPQKSGSISNFKECKLSDLPQIVSWPKDGGAFITLPQVATRPGENASIMTTNVGMYRVQISGNEYEADKECGLHYQIKRDIARHHQKAIEEGRALKVSVFIGGPPSHSIAAVMPMPENLSELLFAGMLGGHRFRYFIHDGYLVSSDADFCILGELQPDLKPEGPFGDHIGYYSDKHEFPYLKVKKVLCKKNAIYPFTVVGRPPQEDTLFGEFIHRITKPMVPASVPGLVALHAVDDAGVHPLCLALAHERFRPYAKADEREPMELLKTANALLGFNQASLSKYLLIAAVEDIDHKTVSSDASEKVSVDNVPAFFSHVLERIDFKRDLHFQTATTIDTLDYTGAKLNHGSKVVIAAAGPIRRKLRSDERDLQDLKIPGIECIKIAMPGVLVMQGCSYDGSNELFKEIEAALENWPYRENYPWVTIVDDDATQGNLDPAKLHDFLWLTFTRSDPAKDIHGFHAFTQEKHWGCEAPMLIDARIKPWHQKALAVSDDIQNRARNILKEENICRGNNG